VIFGIITRYLKYLLDLYIENMYTYYMKEPRIMQMDWKALGYEREYKNGRLRWVPQNVTEDTKDQNPSS
jgi:hypothetical protein